MEGDVQVCGGINISGEGVSIGGYRSRQSRL